MDNQAKAAEEQKFAAAKTEYECLRKEMQGLMEAKFKLECTMFSVFALLIAYLLTLKDINPFNFLVPIPIIFVFYKVHYDYNIYIWRSAAYCVTFFTEKGFVFEKRLMVYRKIKRYFSKKRNVILSPITITEILYGAPCVICIVLFLWKISMKDDYTFIKVSLYGCLLFLGVILIFVCRTFLLRMLPFEQVFLENIRDWTKVKKKEDSVIPSNLQTLTQDISDQ